MRPFAAHAHADVRVRRWPLGASTIAIALAVVAIVAIAAADARADRVDDYVRAQMAARKLPGVSVAVVQRGRIVKAAGYGVASLELHAPATERTVYEIGSISKQFAANAILLLVEDGKLRLDDPIAKYIDKTPAAWSTITIRHVLTHTAGLADFDSGHIGFSYRRDYTIDEFVALVAAAPLQFAPGERWNYTNAFPLLGAIVERASGVPYMTFVETRIFKPLGLASARFKRNGEVVTHRADGYVLKDGAYRHGEPLRPEIIAPNGGILIDVVDFATWDIAVTQGRLLHADSVKEMTSAVRLNDGRTVSHGLGWFMDQFNGHRFGAHWGTTVTGHSAVIRRYVDEGVTVIVLANVDEGGGLAVDAISKRIADFYVPGVAMQGLTPSTDPTPAVTQRWRRALAAVAKGEEHPDAPNLATRLPAPVRARLAAATAANVTWAFLGEERVTPAHFNLDPLLTRFRWYRATAGATRWYLTLRLDAQDRILGAIVEDE